MSINIHFDTGNLAKEEAAGLSALIAAVQPVLPTFAELKALYDSPYGQTATAVSALVTAAPAPAEKRETFEVPEGAAAVRDDEGKATGQVRKRGEPAPGKARRTKAEIAEDEAADAAGGQANISTGDERIDPDHPEDAANAAQDKADEQAEVDSNRDESAPLTPDDVKAAIAPYVTKFGMPAVQEDGPKIFKEALGAPPAGNDFWKLSILPYDDQDKIAKVIDVWGKAVELNPLKRAAV